MMKNNVCILTLILLFFGCSPDRSFEKKEANLRLENNFQNPPDSSRAWVFWFWINGNITKEGITHDLEAMKEVGVGGVLWMEVSGPWWAPDGKVKPYSPQWNELMQWAIEEADRLSLKFDLTLDFGYGSGGPHITPNNSMQDLFWNEIVVQGGERVDVSLPKPEVSMENVGAAWLRPGEQLSQKVIDDLNEIDSYRDIAVWAVPSLFIQESTAIPQLRLRTGLDASTYFLNLEKLSSLENSAIPRDSIFNLTGMMASDGRLIWDAPPGAWKIIRLGHASNYKMTRPCSSDAVGLECDRLSKSGINAHFEAFLKPIFEGAGEKAGKTLKYVHIDSWEAGFQQWSPGFVQEFHKRRGYELHPWLPVLKGTIVESPDLSERFLWDYRNTVSELIIDNYILQLRDLASAYDIMLSNEAYGDLSINIMKYAEASDFPIGEFWTAGKEFFPAYGSKRYQQTTLKAMASAAHTKGITFVGAEAFTSGRKRGDHPYILKGIGDEAFCAGINKLILHLSAHQAYDDMKPGLTHRRWGQHFHRHNTWWDFSTPWFDYLRRSQFMLQQGQFVADVCYFFAEGAPIHVKDMELNLPQGYDYDFCSSDIVQKMKVRNGRIVLPSGMSYRYLLLPDTDRLTLESMEKIQELVESGARVIGQQEIIGVPGLLGYPDADQKVKQIAQQLWDQDKLITETSWVKLFKQEELLPDFEGEGLNYIHRSTEIADIYFVANPEPSEVEITCTFRVAGKIPELWNPETGEIRKLNDYTLSDAGCSVPLIFEPMQSWFVVFRTSSSSGTKKGNNFPEYTLVKNINGSWQVSFDPRWGGPVKPVTFDTLISWPDYNVNSVRYYSGTASYKKSFELSGSQASREKPVYIDLGRVEVMAKVRVNGTDCGITWKPPYRVNITDAVRAGENELEIDVVNTWINRMIGDEFLPEDSDWLNFETLKDWPEWFLNNEPRPSGRFTFTTAKHYTKNDTLVPSGLIGPVKIFNKVQVFEND